MPSDNSEFENLSQRVTRAVGAGPTPTPPSIDDISLSDRPTHVGPIRPTEALPPSENGRYRDPHEIGRGGMGVVWKVYDSKLERWVAIKRVLPNLENYAEVANRFVTEARALAKLSHPNIVGIFDQGQDEGGSYIVMEYVGGANLLELLKQQSTMPVPDAIRLVRKICEGLIEAHRAQIIHRDIKPSNILVDKNGRAKLTDFGLARAGGGSGHSLSGHVLGTEGYMAPEQYADPRQATALSDQYSLAATLYHLVTGRSPRMIHLRLVPEELQELLATALEESPAKRYASIEAFHQALGQVARRDKPQPEAATTKPTASETSEGDSNLAKLYVELKKQAEQNMVRAWQLYEAYDDEQALTLLRSVPEDLRDVSLEQNVEERLEKGKKLEAEIGQRVRNGRTAGLRALVDQYLKLYPQRKDMISLRAQLPNNETATTQPANEANASNSSATGQTQKASPPSLLVAPFDSKAAQAGQQAWAKHLGKPVQWSNGIGMNFRLIPPGEFMMGNEESVEELLQAFPYAQKDWLNDAYPQHRVRLTRPWYAGGHLVTIGNFRKFVESTNYQTEAERLVQQKSGVEKPSWNPLSWFGGASEVSVPAGGWGWDDVAKKFEGYKPEYNWRNTGFPQTDNHPVVNVSWNDAQAFITWLNKNHAAREINGKYRLATEAEWEYMCRIGTTTRYPNGNDPERLPEIANVWDGTAKAKFEALGFGNFIHAKDGFAFSSPVGSYAANAWGVYDLIGNAWEWCQDWYGDNYYQQFANLAAVDPQGPASGSSRCLRGGSWGSNAVYCRSGCRGFYDPPGRSYDIGFRVLLELS